MPRKLDQDKRRQCAQAGPRIGEHVVAVGLQQQASLLFPLTDQNKSKHAVDEQ